MWDRNTQNNHIQNIAKNYFNRKRVLIQKETLDEILKSPTYAQKKQKTKYETKKIQKKQ